MSRSTDEPGDVVRALRDALRGDEAAGTGASFMRGLTIGALIGAAIAGSALWQRRIRRLAEEPEPATNSTAGARVDGARDEETDAGAGRTA